MIKEHPEYNRKQIHELAQTLMDGRVLDELIHKKVEDYNIRWDELMQRVCVNVTAVLTLRHRNESCFNVEDTHTGMNDKVQIAIFFLYPLLQQALQRRQQLEKSLEWASKNDKTLRLIQDSLKATDRHLTAYLADGIDAGQIPQEAQVCIFLSVMPGSN